MIIVRASTTSRRLYSTLWSIYNCNGCDLFKSYICTVLSKLITVKLSSVMHVASVISIHKLMCINVNSHTVWFWVLHFFVCMYIICICTSYMGTLGAYICIGTYAWQNVMACPLFEALHRLTCCRNETRIEERTSWEEDHRYDNWQLQGFRGLDICMHGAIKRQHSTQLDAGLCIGLIS